MLISPDHVVSEVNTVLSVIEGNKDVIRKKKIAMNLFMKG